MTTSEFNIITDFNHPSLSLSKTEIFDINMAKYILGQEIDSEDRKKIRLMIKNKEAGSNLNIHYILGKSSKQNKYGKEYLGRIVPLGNYGLQTLSGDIRRALSRPYYWDLDIINAQCEILNQIAGKNKWTNTYLTELCVNRDDIFMKIIEKNKITRSEVKVIFLSLLFGGRCLDTYDEWIKDKFYPEIQSIMINLSNKYPDLLKTCQKLKPTNPIGSCCAIILQTIERKCLLILDEFLTKNGRSMDTYIHDGGLVRKLSPNESEFPTDLIKKAESYIMDNTGYDLKLTCKSMDTTFKLPNSAPEDKTYAYIKKNFEKTVFKCIDSSNFYQIENRNVKVFTKTDLITSFEHLKYIELNSKGFYIKVSFIKEWLLDENIRAYKKVDTIIPPFECPDDTYNLWDGLEVENIPDEEYDEDVINRVQSIFNHIKFLCNNDERAYEYVISSYSYGIKYPGLKNCVSIIFKSPQGYGKTLLFTFTSDIIGSKYCVKFDKPERDVFGEFNSLLKDKVFFCFEEMSSKIGIKYEEEIKDLISGDIFNITFKRGETSKCRNYLKGFFLTNNDFPIKIPLDDRRFYMVNCNLERPPKIYFDELIKSMRMKQVQKLFYEKLLEINTDIDWIKDRPITEAYRDIKEVSIDIELRFMVNYIEDNIEKNELQVDAKDLFLLFKDFVITQGIMNYQFNNIKFGIRLKNYLISGFEKVRNNRGYIYILNIPIIKNWCISKGIIADDSHIRLL